MKLSTKTILLLFTLLCASKAHGDEFHCGHEQHQQDYPDVFLDVEEDTSTFTEEGRLLASATSYPNMRIHAIYDALSSAPAAFRAYIENELAPPVIDYFQSALRVKAPIVGKLKLGSSVSKICGQPTPAILKSTGVDADFVVFYNSRVEDSSVVASSGQCNKASGTKRPLMGQTNFNRNMLKEAKGNILLHEKNMYLLIHEMMHSFGVSDGAFSSYIDENGKTLKGHVKSIAIAGKTRLVVDVPVLTERLRKFYGCPTIPGVIMENDGGSGTSGSHLERKFFVYETMASGGIFGRRTSEFSLGLLEASGWYSPNYDYAEPFYFGQGQGCDFVNGVCSSSKASFDDFCTGSTRGCAPQGRSGGKCGSDSKSDGCKYIVPDQDYDCDNDDGLDNARLATLEVYGRGAGSKCFTGDLNTRKSTGGATSFCFKYSCVGEGSNVQLQVQVGKDILQCTKKGPMPLNGYYGSINCPDPLAFCGTVGKKYCPRNCMGRGTCDENFQCQCNSGFTGVDCGLKN